MTVALRFRRDRYLRSGDQVSFLSSGYPAVRFTEPNENYDHEHQDVRVENGVQFGDLPQFVDFHFLARVTRVVGSSLAALARSPRPPVSTRAISTNLTYDTHLQLDGRPRSRTWWATRSCGATRTSRCGRTRGSWATSRPTR